MTRVAALVILAIACSDGSTPSSRGPGGGPPLITNANILDHFIGAMCDYFVKCDIEFGRTFDTRMRCQDFFELVFTAQGNPGLDAFSDVSLYTIDSARATACLDAIRATACDTDIDTVTDGNPDCEAAVIGNLAMNDCCDVRGGCGPDLGCEIVPPNDTGTCLPSPAAVSETCWTRECADGHYCDAGAPTPVCVAYAQVTESCVGVQCDPLLYCDTGPDTCATRKAATTSCNSDAECAEGLYCDGSGACATLRSAGQTCDAGDPEGGCDPDLICFANTCTALDWGDSCDPNQGGCPEAFFGGGCYDAPGAAGFTCMRAGMFNDECDFDGVNLPSCALGHGFVCNINSNRCVVMPGENDDCGSTILCDPLPDLYCSVTSVSPVVAFCERRVGENGDCSTQIADNPLLSACLAGYNCDPSDDTCQPAQGAPTCP